MLSKCLTPNLFERQCEFKFKFKSESTGLGDAEMRREPATPLNEGTTLWSESHTLRRARSCLIIGLVFSATEPTRNSFFHHRGTATAIVR